MDSAVSGDPVNSEEEISLKVRPRGPPPRTPPADSGRGRQPAGTGVGGVSALVRKAFTVLSRE